ncbi:uncharacterized protein BXZ73DRAFT_46171 [Epithele typhae]|uniref:uncharacterized protein n=1 Tax=Epithele typhae TaxID=378194 RepID=UPI002008627C|nr:uncharacterized protein BXZ73DRAFT_46171 [Epithele typhae]KAH9933668.1 hypothetical protein BXZ73DRAFT_46171 [Epithele typhae]
MATAEPEAGPSTSHELRITSHGKITQWVAFALEHFKAHEDRPLVLHTLPIQRDREPQQMAEGDVQGETEGGKKEKTERLHPAMATIPRLVSVTEIIKREYLKTLDVKQAEGGVFSGLHQYNEIGSLEDAGLDERAGDEEQERMASLARALQGRNHLKMKKTAFMRVTLSRTELPGLVLRGATHQPPGTRKLSRSTRARLRKRAAAVGTKDE